MMRVIDRFFQRVIPYPTFDKLRVVRAWKNPYIEPEFKGKPVLELYHKTIWRESNFICEEGFKSNLGGWSSKGRGVPLVNYFELDKLRSGHILVCHSSTEPPEEKYIKRFESNIWPNFISDYVIPKNNVDIMYILEINVKDPFEGVEKECDRDCDKGDPFPEKCDCLLNPRIKTEDLVIEEFIKN